MHTRDWLSSQIFDTQKVFPYLAIECRRIGGESVCVCVRVPVSWEGELESVIGLYLLYEKIGLRNLQASLLRDTSDAKKLK